MTKGILGRKVGMTQVFTEKRRTYSSNSNRSSTKRGTSKEDC